jgi:hypothetical protein
MARSPVTRAADPFSSRYGHPDSCAGTFRSKAELAGPLRPALPCTSRKAQPLWRPCSPWWAAADGQRACPRPRTPREKMAPPPAARWIAPSHPTPLGRMGALSRRTAVPHVRGDLLVRPLQPLSAVLPTDARRRCVLHLGVKLRLVVHGRLRLRCGGSNG